MKFLVTGGSGFIGSNFIHTLFHIYGKKTSKDLSDYNTEIINEPFEIVNIDNLTYASNSINLNGIEDFPEYKFYKADISERGEIESIFKYFKPDIVVHFAAESHVDRSIESGEIFVKTNVLGTQILLDLARSYNVKKFIHVSTDEVYGSAEEGSFDEEDKLNTSSPYSASKAGSDLLVLSHHITYGTPVIITRCTNNYGPRQHNEKLLPKIIDLVGKQKLIPIYGDGSNIRDWLYVKDHCMAIIEVINKAEIGTIWNIAAGDERNNIDVVKKVLRASGSDENMYEFIEDRAGHDWRYSIDDSKLRNIGWRPLTDFNKGLQHTIEWYNGVKE